MSWINKKNCSQIDLPVRINHDFEQFETACTLVLDLCLRSSEISDMRS